MARAPALQAGGHRFESDILHKRKKEKVRGVKKRVRYVYQRVECCLILWGRTCNLHYSEVKYLDQEDKKRWTEFYGTKKVH